MQFFFETWPHYPSTDPSKKYAIILAVPIRSIYKYPYKYRMKCTIFPQTFFFYLLQAGRSHYYCYYEIQISNGSLRVCGMLGMDMTMCL